MKKLLFLFITLGICFQSQCQYFVSESSLWSVSEEGTLPGPTRFFWLNFQGDTTIDDHAYKKILRSNTLDQTQWNTIGFIREDSIGRVYRNYNSTDFLLYDFSLEQGDSLAVYHYLTNPIFEGHIYVDSLAYKTFGLSPKIRKHIYFNVNLTWIEGLGNLSESPIDFFQFSPTGAILDVLCYSENSDLIYHNENFSNCFPVSAPSSPLANQQVRVTQGNGWVLFRAEGVATHNADFQLLDIMGRVIRHERLAGQMEWEVPLADLPPGIYIYQLRTAAGVLAGKFYTH